MKILQCITSLEGGGAERQFGYLCESLVKLGVDVTAISLRGGQNLDRVLQSGAKYLQVLHTGNFDPQIVRRLLWVMRTERPDVVQTWIPQMDILGGATARWERIPYVISERTSRAGLPRGWRETARVAVGRRAAAIVANGAGGESYWLERAPEIPLSVISNSIPFAEIESAVSLEDDETGLGEIDELVVYLGQMVALKNIANLVPALSRVVSSRTQAKAAMIGDGPLSEEARISLSIAGVGNRARVFPFTLKPFSWLKRASVFVSVSHFEGNPNAVLEAVAAGCPVVVSDIPAHREFLDDRSARFVLGQSVESIAAGVLDVLQDPIAARERADRARERIARRTGDAIARKYMEVYESVRQRGTDLRGLRGVSGRAKVEPTFQCPSCGGSLRGAETSSVGNSFASSLHCTQCSSAYPVVNSVPRFVRDSGYSSSFGFQWKRYVRTQLDSYSGAPISHTRLFHTSLWPKDMGGEVILEAGSGAGRFTEILLGTGAKVFSFDYSDAVDANFSNNGANPNLRLFQADIYAIPFARASFDKVICLGVIQHTPDPEWAFRKLSEMVRPGGELVVDCYSRNLAALLHWKYVLRPITKRMDKELLYRIIAISTPWLIPMARILRSIGGRIGARLVPIVEYSHLGLSENLNQEWAILDTFDMYSPAYDNPQRVWTIRRWFESEGFSDITVVRSYNGVVGRGRKI